jgi:hypothetical protein
VYKRQIYSYLLLNTSTENFYLNLNEILCLYPNIMNDIHFNFLYFIIIIVLTKINLLFLKYKKKNFFNFIILILLMFFFYNEYYLFYHINNYFYNYLFVLNNDDLTWNIELESFYTQPLFYYVYIVVILKLFHLIFVIFFFFFYFNISLFNYENSYLVTAFSLQNFFFIYFFIWIFQFFLLKFFLKSTMSVTYYMCFIQNNLLFWNQLIYHLYDTTLFYNFYKNNSFYLINDFYCYFL